MPSVCLNKIERKKVKKYQISTIYLGGIIERKKTIFVRVTRKYFFPKLFLSFLIFYLIS